MGYMTQNDGDEHWNKPMINTIKINSDTTIFEESTYFSHAFAVRDHEGQLVEAKSRCLPSQISPVLA